MNDPVHVSVVLEPGAALPEYQSDGAAGADVRCLQPVELQPMERKLVRTGLRVAIPEGYEIQVRPRSGFAVRHGLGMVNSPGTIDSDYRGEVQVILVNWGSEPVRLEAGERIAQWVLCPVVRARFLPTESLDDTERGESGFGSTGTR